MTDMSFKLPILSIKGENVGRDFDLSCLQNVKFNEHLIYLALKCYLANQRQGTHKTKEKSDLSGSTRKLFRQKGTGGARRGSIKSPLLRGGATVFGPRPRDYDFKFNEKEKKLAILSLLKSKLCNNAVNIIDLFSIPDCKTKSFISIKNDLKLSQEKVLLIPDENNRNLLLSSRNLNNIYVKVFNFVNIYDIILADKIFFEEKAISDFLVRVKI